MPKSTRRDELAALLVERLDAFGLETTLIEAKAVVDGRVDELAADMRIQKHAAMALLDDEAIANMAEALAFGRAEEAPGASMFDAERDVVLKPAGLAMAAAALAECIAFFVRIQDQMVADVWKRRMDESTMLLAQLAQIAKDGFMERDDRALAPAPLLYRVSSFIGSTAVFVDALDASDIAPSLAAAFRRDAEIMRMFPRPRPAS
jgi:hypothetical protein